MKKKKTIWYHKTELCRGCRSDNCESPPEYKYQNEIVKCPCVICLVKVVCNSFCCHYENYHYFKHYRSIRGKAKCLEAKIV
jgi:hypothetical protein